MLAKVISTYIVESWVCVVRNVYNDNGNYYRLWQNIITQSNHGQSVALPGGQGTQELELEQGFGDWTAGA